MRQSELFSRTTKNISKDELSINAQLLTRAGYISKLMAGVYSMLPLGLKVLNKVENIIRQEMASLGAQEVLLPALQPREIWDKTGRWDKVDVLYKFKGRGERELALGPTHEEVVTPLIGSFVQSYRDLPIFVYQVQTKFRDESRAKSGLLRGREFRMKDMYSFHSSQGELDEFYAETIKAYVRVFERCGIGDKTYLTYASGGIFSKYSHEFQTVTQYGEDSVYVIPDTKIAINKEIVDDPEVLSELLGNIPKERLLQNEHRAIEVGNIFKLGTRFSSMVGANYVAQDGTSQPIIMGCYGIGSSRLIGTIVECLHDASGIKWPEEIAPFRLHLLSLGRSESEQRIADDVFSKFSRAGIEVLFDDRADLSAGEKFKDSDLIGIPHRAVISSRTISQDRIEYKRRDSDSATLITFEELLKAIL